MASVTSLDKDLRQLRLDKYTPAAANEARSWIENVLGTRLPSNDLLDGLKDGVALCKLINLAVGPPGVKFKTSAMPFIQMENISHFLRACQSPPLNLQDHDMFLTVDLYERKDPAQVLQCLGAFSRAAHSVNPAAFPSPIGPRARGSTMSPQSTGPTTPRTRGVSNVSNNSSTYGSRSAMLPSRTGDSGSGRWSPTKSPTANSERAGSNVSSWSKRDHEGVTSPAWNIAQYGYMGGASQGNLGISFGGRRQITTASPQVPSFAEKERRRKEQEAEIERQRLQSEEEERIRKAELEAEEERARVAEQRRWEEETTRLRAEEKRKADDEKRRWEEEERQWKITEEKRRREEEDAEARLAEERRLARSPRLQGQFLSQYQAEQGITPQKSGGGGYSDRIKQLEEELELARQREQQYEEERQRRSQNRARSRSRPGKPERPPSRQDSWRPKDERQFLSTQWNREREREREQEQEQVFAPPPPPRPLPVPVSVPAPGPVKTHRTGERLPPLPVKPQRTGENRPLPIPDRVKKQVTGSPGPNPSSRPLPVPSANPNGSSRTDRYLATNPAPAPPPPQQTYSRELDATAERDAEDRRRAESQAKTKAAGWAGKSLLEREMEMERQRQREWEEAQQETAKAARSGDGVDGIGGGIGGRWDVSQWSGFTGGDSQNKGGAGIGAGRRQIVGPRPLPSRPGS
ncbi:uncharacterized protein GGS22DRAFT_167184 [Annulohypoxylon maeteangense]|uniref:uncharacterized protein n=1 Tax=Annulohypoxylon maeteangense TaxID=1927788 RepID=UPI0020076593|nr:uncharacterized protein GGS22DRAFT_167184 [Annulohypoxylon maeteangense]KAI0883515.1 hypothetical protein GGS22DRAFT_167184 [Annulohypoxylon maeteangense]